MSISKEESRKYLDRKILETIDEELGKLEKMASEKEHQSQIGERRRGISKFFNNFDHNMDLILEKNGHRYPFSKKIIVTNPAQALDKMMQSRIENRMNRIFSNATHSKDGKSGKLNDEITQINNRKLGVLELLNNYDENMKFLTEKVREPQERCIG